jgi:hypothetical protein
MNKTVDIKTAIECRTREGYAATTRQRFKSWRHWNFYASRAAAEEAIPKLMERHERLEFRIKPD